MYNVHFFLTTTGIPRRELVKLFEELPYHVVESPRNGAINVALELSIPWEEFQGIVEKAKKSKSL